jgi:hypothetical protein
VIALLVGAVMSTAGCSKQESRHDLYMRAMTLEGAAERGECKLAYDQEAAAHVLDGDQIQSCLRALDEALALYDRAHERGLKDLDFVRARERAQQRRTKIQGMLRVVREMETPVYKLPGS